MDITSNKMMLWGMLVILVAGIAVLIRAMAGESGSIPDIGVSNRPQTPLEEGAQIQLRLDGMAATSSREVPFKYTLAWSSLDTNNCQLITDVKPLSHNALPNFEIQPGMIAQEQVNSIAKQDFEIKAISAPATISHTLSCQNRAASGPDVVVERVEFIANDSKSKTMVCAFDSNFDGVIDYHDLGNFALKYHRKLKACAKDIAGGDCFIDELDFLTFESAYNVRGVCD